MTDDTSTHAARLSQASSVLSTASDSAPLDKAGRAVCIGNLVLDTDTDDVGVVLLVAADSVAYLRIACPADQNGRLMLSGSRASALVVSDFPPLSPSSILQLARQHGLPAADAAASAPPPGELRVRRIAGEIVQAKRLPSMEAIDQAARQLAQLVEAITPLLALASDYANEELAFIDAGIRVDVHSLADALLQAITTLQADTLRARATFAAMPSQRHRLRLGSTH